MSEPTTAPKPTKKRRAGRPRGAQTQQRDTVAGELTRCPRCGSTERTKYTNTRELAHPGIEADKPYTHTVWRDCSCKSCGQARTDRVRENRPQN